MTNNKFSHILEDKHIASIKDLVDYIVFHDEQAKALDLSTKLERAINSNIVDLKLQPVTWEFYKNVLLKLKFICLSALDEKEVISLIKNNFCFQFQIPDYDIIKKMDAVILNIIIAERRNSFKEETRKALLENNERISPNFEIVTVRDWLKNYVSRVGLEGADKLARAQYLVGLKNNKNIKPIEHDHLVALFKLYDYLSIPADSPQGLSEELPIVVQGKLYIFRKGVLEPVSDRNEVEEAVNLLEDNQIINSQEEDKNKIQVVPPAVLPIVSSSTPYSGMLADLEQALKSYPTDSLEHKAIKQEINRLKVAAFKQAQKTNVKK